MGSRVRCRSRVMFRRFRCTLFVVFRRKTDVAIATDRTVPKPLPIGETHAAGITKRNERPKKVGRNHFAPRASLGLAGYATQQSNHLNNYIFTSFFDLEKPPFTCMNVPLLATIEGGCSATRSCLLNRGRFQVEHFSRMLCERSNGMTS